jgi:hypothetical protein
MGAAAPVAWDSLWIRDGSHARGECSKHDENGSEAHVARCAEWSAGNVNGERLTTGRNWFYRISLLALALPVHPRIACAMAIS